MIQVLRKLLADQLPWTRKNKKGKENLDLSCWCVFVEGVIVRDREKGKGWKSHDEIWFRCDIR